MCYPVFSIGRGGWSGFAKFRFPAVALFCLAACTMSKAEVTEQVDRAVDAFESLNRPPQKIVLPAPTVIEKTFHVENKVDEAALLAAAAQQSTSSLAEFSSRLFTLQDQAAAALSEHIQDLERQIARLGARDDEHHRAVTVGVAGLGARLDSLQGELDSTADDVADNALAVVGWEERIAQPLRDYREREAKGGTVAQADLKDDVEDAVAVEVRKFLATFGILGAVGILALVTWFCRPWLKVAVAYFKR